MYLWSCRNISRPADVLFVDQLTKLCVCLRTEREADQVWSPRKHFNKQFLYNVVFKSWTISKQPLHHLSRGCLKRSERTKGVWNLFLGGKTRNTKVSVYLYVERKDWKDSYCCRVKSPKTPPLWENQTLASISQHLQNGSTRKIVQMWIKWGNVGRYSFHLISTMRIGCLIPF